MQGTNDIPIGRVVATERHPTTTGHVRFWLKEGAQLKPFDFVRISPPETADKKIGEFYAIVHEIEQVSDESSALSSFVSADFGLAEIAPRIGRVVTTYADAAVLFNTEDIEMPVPHGARVHWPDEIGVRRALGILDFERGTPAGYITMSGPEQETLTIHVDLDTDYLAGPEGAHLNISGVSGVATKTSYAMFLLTAIQQKQKEAAAKGRQQAGFIILNVKGGDLLQLDEVDPELDDNTRRDWEKCGLEAGPLENVTYFFPYGGSDFKSQTRLDSAAVEARVKGGKAYRYYYDARRTLEHMSLLVEDIDDPRDMFASCVHYCMDQIDHTSEWQDLREKVQTWAQSAPDKKVPVVSWRRFARLFEQRTRNVMFDEKENRATQVGQVPLKEVLEHLKPGHVVVVDIAELPDYLQNLVVGDLIEILRRAKADTSDAEPEDEGEEEVYEEIMQRPETVILFADELNKFAPRQGQARSITRHLREMSERGRSEGIILFGAEQFRTGVDDRVTGNCATQVFGRTTASEANKDPEIKGLPGKQSQRVPFLRKGELLVSHTRFSAGTLKLRFPRNAYRRE